MYVCMQVSPTFCAYIAANSSEAVGSLLNIMAGKIEIADMEFNSVIEMVLYTLSVLIMQVGSIPQE